MHTVRDKKKLLHRIKRIRGQLEGIQRAIESEDHDCFGVLRNVSACRGALNGLMTEIIEGQLFSHVIDPNKKHTKEQGAAAENLMEVIRTYLR